MNPFYNIYRFGLCSITFLLFYSISWSQTPSEARYSMQFTDQTMEEVFQYIENRTHWTIYYEKELLPDRSFTKDYVHFNIPDLITDLLSYSNLDCLTYRNYAIVILPKKINNPDFPPIYYQRFVDSKRSHTNKSILKIGQFSQLDADGYTDIRIKVIRQDQTVIPNATVRIKSTKEVDRSDQNGVARISLLSGKYTLQIQHPDFEPTTQLIDIYSSGVISIYMSEKEKT